MTDPLTDCDILVIPTTDKTELAQTLKELVGEEHLKFQAA